MTDIFSTKEHWDHFAEFARWERASGGPDPQLAMVARMTGADDGGPATPERVWQALCYIASYNVPFGEVFWTELPWEESSRWSEGDFFKWSQARFSEGKIVTRVERRCVRRADWMSEYLAGAVRLVGKYESQAELMRSEGADPEVSYEMVWDWALSHPRIGRYVAIKLLEYMRRYLGMRIETPDIRPKGAWSPRETLGTLWPGRQLEVRDDSREAQRAVNAYCASTIARLEEDYQVGIDLFQLQVILCEYRESWEGKKQYPGRSLDSELGYVRKAEELWGRESSIWEARGQLFPHEHLGELHGWDGPRKDVGRCLATNRYTWTDLMYDYPRTAAQGSLSSPVLREAEAVA